MNWLKRSRQREYDIAQGADAGLFRDNARRSLWSLGLLAGAFLLGWIAPKVPVVYGLRLFVRMLAALSLLAGAILFYWSRAERTFLHQPDREGPPSILKQ